MSTGSFSRRNRAPLLMALPAAAFTVLMIAFPVGYTVWLSFRTTPLGHASHFNGLTNYARMFEGSDFWGSIRVSFVLYVLALVFELICGTTLALLLFRMERMPAILRSVLISPFMVPPVVVGMMFLMILDPTIGVANWLLGLVGIAPSAWLASPQWVIPTFALIDTWQWTPFVALIVLGGLQSLPSSLFEAARIDGARAPYIFWRVTLPLLRPTLVTALILRSVDLLRFFDIIYVTTQGGPLDASNTLNVFTFHVGFELFQFGYASALAVTLTAVVFGVVLALNQLREQMVWG